MSEMWRSNQDLDEGNGVSPAGFSVLSCEKIGACGGFVLPRRIELKCCIESGIERGYIMATVEEIQSEIESLPHRDYIRLMRWIHQKDWQDWDKELDKDASFGKLDFLIEEALDEKKKGKLREL